jgi:predicted PurR-regulated permease PerM
MYWERLQKPLIRMEQQAILSEERLQEEVSAEIARESPEKVPATEPAQPLRTGSTQSVESASQSDNEEGSLRSSLIGMIQGVFGQVKGVALNTTEMLIVLVTVFFGVTFTLMNPRPVFGALFSVVPERHHDRTLAIMQRIAAFVPRWAGAVLISMVTIGSLFFLLMWPIFGFTDAIMLGLIACLFSAIPFLGPVLSLIPALLLALGEGGLTPMWVFLAYLAVQALEGNVILPIVMSRGMKLHPVAVIFSMLLSVAAFGVLGVLIAAPLVAIVGIVYEELYRKHFLPTVTDEDLDRLARGALFEKRSGKD